MVYEFECAKCGARTEVRCSMRERDNLSDTCPCGGHLDQFWSRMQFRLGQTFGRDSGFYNQDYGKHVTWDLTVPGKMERLKKEGIIKDPFDDVAPREIAGGDEI